MLDHLKFSFRRIKQNFGSSMLAIFILAMGISLSTTMFAIVKTMTWSSPDVGSTHPLNFIRWQGAADQQNGIPLDIVDYDTLRETISEYAYVTTFSRDEASIFNPKGDANARIYDRAYFKEGFFDIVKIQPILGRVFDNEDFDRDEDIAVISYRIWQDLYSGDPEVIGKTISINTRPYIIIGVMPESFQFPFRQDVWAKGNWDWAKGRPKSDQPTTFALLSMKEGKSKQELELALQREVQNLKQNYPKANENKNRIEFVEYPDLFGNAESKILHLLLLCALLVLLAACTNVSNLILASLGKRKSELSIKRALGGSKRNIFISVQVDALILIVISLFVSFLLSSWLCRIVWDNVVETRVFLPYWWEVKIDYQVTFFAILISSFSLLLISAFPAVRAISVSIMSVLKDDNRTSSGFFTGRFSKVLIGIQISVSLVLLVVSLSLSHVVNEYRNIKMPYDPSKILQFTLFANVHIGYKTDESVRQFFSRIPDKIQSIPGITKVAISRSYLGLYARQNDFKIEGMDNFVERESLRSNVDVISKNFFDVYGIQPSIGRGFSIADKMDSELVAIVNESFVNQHFGGESPIGKRIAINEISGWWDPRRSTEPWSEYIKIVGVVKTLNPQIIDSRTSQARSMIYLPFSQHQSRGMTVLMTSKGNAEEYVDQIKAVLREENRHLALSTDINTVARQIDNEESELYIIVYLFYLFSFASLFMVSVGLYGLISYSTRQRYREFGIRMALGATPEKIILTMFKSLRIEILISSVVGLSVGIFVAKLAVSSLNFGDAFSINYILVAGAFAAVYLAVSIAVFMPSYQATKCKPSLALRYE